MKDRFGIGCRSKLVACRIECCLELTVVVDLAVEADAQRPILVRHRLSSAFREIDDAQSSMAEPKIVLWNIFTSAIIGPAMDQRLHHPLNDGRFIGAVKPRIGKAGESADSTHRLSPQPFLFVYFCRDHRFVHRHQRAEDEPRPAVEKSTPDDVHPDKSK